MIDLKCGDCLEVIKSLPSKSVDMIITSPPYFGLRDYGSDKEIGKETNYQEYLQNLILIFVEAQRVLKDSGSCWVNINDVYATNNKDIKKQSLLCIPDRLKIAMVEAGYICRNEIIWHKPNAMPSSAKTRFNNDYEKLYFFTKNSDYYFKTQYEPLKSKLPKAQHKTKRVEISKYTDEQQEAAVRAGMNRKRGERLIALRKDLPQQLEFVEFIRSRANIDLIAEHTDIKRTTIEHWFRKDKSGFAYPSIEDWNNVKWLLNDWSEEFKKIDDQLTNVTYETDDILKNVNNGRIKRAVWSICTKPFKGSHFAPYPEELIVTPILACCPENGTVLDPFMGSGTTGVVCKKYNRNFIGIDINAKYIEVAKERISNVSKRSKGA